MHASTVVAPSIDLSNPAHRERVLSQGPLGTWSTYAGTYPFMQGTVRFDADGTGEWTQGTDRFRFHWRHVTHGVIEYQHIDFPFEIDADEDDGERSWYRIAYVVELCTSDIGAMWALKQLDRAGFMDQVAPLIPVARETPRAAV